MTKPHKVPKIYESIPSQDYLGILEEKQPKKVVAFLNFTTDDVANATRLPKESIRYDKRMSQELSDRLQEISNICALVADYFQGDLKKTQLWFKIRNPLLGNISPRDMIRIGRYQKLLKFIQDSREGNFP